MTKLRGFAVLALAGLIVAGPAASQTEPPTAAAAATEVVATVDADGIQRVEIVGGSYFFKPGRVVVKVNVPVELKVRKESGLAPHNVVVRAPDAGVSFSVDLTTEPRTISFTPTKAGVYPIYCDKRFLFFSSHRDRGMEGVLDVRE
jgi:plastocyanin